MIQPMRWRSDASMAEILIVRLALQPSHNMLINIGLGKHFQRFMTYCKISFR